LISLILIIGNEREEQILKLAFEQKGIKVTSSKPNYQNYILASQFKPDIILMELPHLCQDQLDFAARIRSYKRTHLVPILGYGNKTDDGFKRGIHDHGVTVYLERPLKYTLLLKHIEQLLKPFNKAFENPIETTSKEKDLELILNSDTVGSQKIDAMIRHVSTLMAFPFTIAKVLQITQNQTTGANDLAHAISADPAISTHLLKVSNSVFFASSNRRINSLKDAIVRIGFLETKKIVMSMSVMKLFNQENKNIGFDRIDFWYHSLAAGLISERVARQIGGVNVEEAFLAGLLHDLGIIILDEFLSPVFEHVLVETSKTGGHFISCEDAIIGVNHNDLIGGLFPIWKIPQEITDAIILQEKIDSIKDFDTTGKNLALCVAIGNLLAKTLRIGRECDEYITPVDNMIFQKAKMSTGLPKDFEEYVNHNLELFRKFLGLEKREYNVNSCIENPSEIKIAFVNPSKDLFIAPYHYLKNEGFQTQFITHESGSLTANDSKYDLVVIWKPAEMNKEKIIELSRIIKFQRENDSNKTEPEFAPLLIMASEINFDIPEAVSHMPQRFDLRQLDSNLDRILKGEIVRQRLSAPSKEISTENETIPDKPLKSEKNTVNKISKSK
jgi:HD-like signal output (HDOD) protein/CheY-like chemotaxis protein